MPIATINPANGKTLQTFESLTADEIDQKLTLGASTWQQYRRTTFEQRAEWLRHAADILDGEDHKLARLMTIEMGKPIAAAVAEVAKCAGACRYYADNGSRFLSDESAPASEGQARVAYQPMGVVLAIMPWNF